MSCIGSVRKKRIYHNYIEWDIDYYFSRSQKADTYIQSPDFVFWDTAWFLTLYPNGSRLNDSVGYVGVFLNKVYPQSSHEFSVNCTMGIKYEDGEVFEERSNIICSFNSGDSSGGISDFIERNILYQKKTQLAPYNVLKVFCRFHLIKDWKIPFDGNFCCKNCDASYNHLQNLEVHQDYFCQKKVTKQRLGSGKYSKNCGNNSKSEVECDTESESEAESVGEGEIGDKAESATEGLDILSKDLKQLFLSEEDCDVKIKVKDQEFNAHRVILAARSLVFSAMFKHNMKERSTGIVNIVDCEPDAFKEFLCYLYSGKVEQLSLDIAIDLYSLSSKYDFKDLKKICVPFLSKQLSIDSFCDIMALAVKHKEDELIKCSTEFFIRHAKCIIRTMKWELFLKENVTIGNELFLKTL